MRGRDCFAQVLPRKATLKSYLVYVTLTIGWEILAKFMPGSEIYCFQKPISKNRMLAQNSGLYNSGIG